MARSVAVTAEKPSFEPVILGRVTGLFGVRGWVKIYSYTEPREAVLGYGPWWLRRDGSDWRQVRVTEGQRHGRSVVARLDGYDDRDAAAELLDADIAVAPEALPEPAEGQYYWHDLAGLEVVHRDGTRLGRVARILETGANDVLVVEGDRERLIPFVPEKVILDVDLANGEILVDWEWD